ncbi:MAG: glycosyltransferase family 2 protein [Myxococcales bacterium]
MSTRALVVVPCLNEAPYIEGVLRRLLQQRTDGLDLQLVVADGGSQDGTREIVRALARQEPRLRLIENPARIQSAAVNLAVRRYGRDADVLIRCDAHAEYPEDYCARLVETLERTQADAVVVPLDSKGETPLQKAIAWVSNSPVGTGGSAHRGGHTSGFVDHGHHAAFRMSSFRAAGGYDQSFTHNEDAELDCRQRALGARIYLNSELRVGYSPRKTLPALYRQYFKYGEGRSRTVRRHPHSLRLRQLAVPAHLALSGLALLAMPWTAWLLVWPALYLSVLCAVACQLAVRQRDFAALLGVAAAATMHTAWALGFFVGFFAHRERLWGRHMAVPLRLRSVTGEVS